VEMEEKQPSGGSSVALFESFARKAERRVFVTMVYVRYLSDLIVLDSTFSCCFGLDMEWDASEDDFKRFKENDREYVPDWIPKFEFPAAKEIEMEARELAHGCPYEIRGERNFMRTLVTATFICPYDLRMYPFDYHDLKVVWDMSFNMIDKAIFIPHEGSVGSSAGTQLRFDTSFMVMPEFHLHRALLTFKVAGEPGYYWSQVIVTFQLARLPHGPLVRIVFPAFLLSALTLVTFSFDLTNNFIDRINFLITLILAMTAFQFVIQSILPMTPYTMLIDIFLYNCFLAPFVLAAVLSLGIVIEPETFIEHEKPFFWVYFSLWLAGNAYCVLLCVRQLSRFLEYFSRGQRELDAAIEHHPVFQIKGTDMQAESREKGVPFASFATQSAREKSATRGSWFPASLVDH
jgi:hypothetical protein